MMGQQLCAAGKFSSKSTHWDFGKSFPVLIESATDHKFPREKHSFVSLGLVAMWDILNILKNCIVSY